MKCAGVLFEIPHCVRNDDRCENGERNGVVIPNAAKRSEGTQTITVIPRLVIPNAAKRSEGTKTITNH
jgi:hypothetical protein